MRSDPRVGAISPADALQVWVVRSVRRGAKLWLPAVPGPSPATGPEEMPELEGKIQFRRHQASCCAQGGARVARPSADAALDS